MIVINIVHNYVGTFCGAATVKILRGFSLGQNCGFSGESSN